jgi:hypothetical protein
MATTSVPTAPDPAVPTPRAARAEHVVEYRDFTQQQLDRTRSHVKWTELSGALLTLVLGAAACLMALTVLDAWVLPGGLGTVGRWLAWCLLLGGLVGYAARVLLPLVVRRINPLYAAQTIERARPSLKNSVINFLLLRRDPQPTAAPVLEAVEQRAATDLAQVPVESTVDRGRLLRLAYALLGLVVVAAVYTVLSPKSPFSSVARVVFPWANLSPPAAVTIEEVSPGDAEVLRGGFVEVAAVVQGAGERPVTLHYTTADGQTVDQPLEMLRGEGDYRYRVTLPVDKDGLRQDVQYYVTAGDARTQAYRVTVLPAPTIQVERTDLDFPDYTRLERLSVPGGDVQALEGTRVTLLARANQPVAQAWLDLGCDGVRDGALTVRAGDVSGSFTLRLRPDGTPEHDCYQVRFQNDRGHENPQPIRYRMAVTRDLPPEILPLEPSQEQVELPANSALEVALRAFDPDYELTSLALRFEHEGTLLEEPALLDKPSAESVERRHTFSPQRHRLQAGDVVTYWATATDNKAPQANETESPKRTIRIVEPAPQDQLARADDPQPRDEPQADAGRGHERNVDPADREDGAEENPADAEDAPGQPRQGENPQPEEQPTDASDGGGDDSTMGETGRQQERPMGGEGERNQDQGGGEQSPDAEQSPDQQQAEDAQGQEDGAGQSGAQAGAQPGSQQQPGGEAGDSTQTGAEGSEPRGDGQDGSAGESETAGGSPGGTRRTTSDRVDPEASAGDAFDEINQYRQEQQSAGRDGAAGQSAANPPPGGETAEGDTDDAAATDGSDGGSPNQGQGRELTDTGVTEPMDAGSGEQAADAEASAGHGRQQRPDAENVGDNPAAGAERTEDDAAAEPSADETDDEAPGDRPGTEEQQPEPGDAGASQRTSDGEGGATRGTNRNQEQPEGQGEEQPMASGGEPEQELGDPGAGEASDDLGSGSPSPQTHQRQRPKTRQPGSPPSEGTDNQAETPSTSEHESDSEGEGAEGGRAGGGDQGSGQRASSPGTGGPGENTESDEGGSRAPTPGEGETSDQPGENAPADGATGSPGEEQGPGSRSRPGGEQPGGTNDSTGQPRGDSTGADDAPAGQSTGDEPRTPQGNSDAQRDGGGQNGRGGPRPGAGNPAEETGATPPQPRETEEPGGDDPNLEYARQATDLALEYLKDQLAQEEPDQELLDRLGWSREDMQRFVDRWDELHQRAHEPGAAGDEAQRELDDRLESLGLRPQGTELAGDRVTDETSRDTVRESRRSDPPPEYAEQQRAYLRSRAKGPQPQGE